MDEETAQQEQTETTQETADEATDAKRGSGTLDELLAGLDEEARKAVSGVVAKLRNENASYRTKLRETEPLAQEAQKLRESQKTDVEKLTDRVSQAEKLASEKDLQIARLSAVLEHGLEMDDVELLGGSTAEEIAQKAARLSARLGSKGLRGKPKEQLRGGASKEDDELSDEREDPAKLAARIRSRGHYG